MVELNDPVPAARATGAVKTAWKRALTGVVAAGMALVLAACGGGSGNADKGAGSGLATLKIGVVPAATFAPLFVGVKQGIFKKHGVDLKLDVGGLAPTIFPRVLKGELDLGANTWGTLVTAGSNGLPLVGISPVDRGGDSAGNDYQGLVARKGGVKDLKSLEGKTIAVPSLKSFTDSQVRSVLQANGVDTSTIKFLALGFPDMPSALAQGRVDAASVIEPFLSGVVKQGNTLLAPLSRGQVMGCIVTSKKFLAENPKAVKAFQAGMQETLAYSKAHPDAVRAALVEGIGLPPESAKAMTLPIWAPSVTEGDVQAIADMMLKVGGVDKPVKAADIMAPARGD
ncbi:ABC transporter substrate-binding protein [Actinomadura sp. SCN-SB]|uniref:ABC transporter substrate-binding protein n=1 Tax=Actinomadura sp. SCN-SB TaxID=3373092 RepID=UPI003751E58E